MPDLANDLSGRLWNLVRADEDNPVKSGFVKVGSISWQGYSTDMDHVLVEDGKGVKLFESFGNADLSPISTSFSQPIWIHNMILADLTSGAVVVEVH